MTTIKNEDLLNRGLPKWPQMIVTGTKVFEEQALEIIRRTDDFFTWHIGNNREFMKQADAALGWPTFPHNIDEFPSYIEERDRVVEAWGYIETEYVTNSWISCSFIGGPHGWCHPDGSIGYIDNVGKWPTVEAVYDDWKRLAQAFPFIEVEATLMDGEDCEADAKPVVSFLIRNGGVELVDPLLRDIHSEFNRSILPERNMEEIIPKVFSVDRSIENAIPLEKLWEWGNAFRKQYP